MRPEDHEQSLQLRNGG
ncbi:unnamed protein product, partial [Onchocerca ochengi]